MKVTIYTSFGWSPCKLVKAWLDKEGITYVEKRVDDWTDSQPSGREELLNMGFRSTPVIMVDETPIVGYNPKRLAEIFNK